MVIVAPAFRDPSSLHCLGCKVARTVAVFSALVGAGMDLLAVRTISFCSAQRLLIMGMADDRSWFGPQRIRPRNRSRTRCGSLPMVATFTLSDWRWRSRVRQSFYEATFVARKPGIQRRSKEWIRVAEIGGHSFTRSRRVLPIKKLRLSPADGGANDQSVHKRSYIAASRNLPFLFEIKRQIMEDNCS
jgi:hypothetical protein